MVALGAYCPKPTLPVQRSTTSSGHWRDDGSWKRIHEHLVQWVRVSDNRDPTPSAASIDSQTVPTAVMVDEAVGYDATKKIKGRKRFTLVDTLGLLIAVQVVAANTPEREGAKQLLNQTQSKPASTQIHDWRGFGLMLVFQVGSFSTG